MKRLGWILLLVAVVPIHLSAGSRKMTVGELQDMLTGLHKAGKGDEQVANELKQIELTEELTTSAMDSMAKLINGPLSTEQIYVLEARSAMLAPPDADLPKDAPPDAAAQLALLAKAQDYAAKIYPQLPRLTATRLIARFQDGVETIQSSGGIRNRIGSADDPLQDRINYYVRLVNTHLDTVEINNGIEKPGGKDTTPWGRNGLVNSMLPFVPLGALTSEAVSSGEPKFLRWETIDGYRTAVFGFTVNKKKSQYAINYCCFPETTSVGNVLYGGSGSSGGANLSPAGGNLSASPYSQPAHDSISYVADWKPFKTQSGYVGELFLDPDSGVVLRTIVRARLLKSSDFVHYEDIRVDYAPISVGGNKLGVPVRSFINAEVVPNGDSFVSRYGLRDQYVMQSYKDFHGTEGGYEVASLLTQGVKTPESQGGRTAVSVTSSTLGGVDDDDPPPGGFPALESVSRPDGPLAIGASAKSFQRPPDDEIKSLLDKAAQNANDYWDSLPNFTCRKVTDRFGDSSGGGKWEHIDTITGQLDYFDHQEEWVFLEYDKDHQKALESNSELRHGMSDYGIFGDTIRGLFRPSVTPEISWFENDTLGDRTVEVFKYRVAKENSRLYLRAGSKELAVVGYHGMVYIDSATGEVRRITEVADDVPKHYPIYETLISADYDHVSIGGQQYLLPIGSQIVLRRSHGGSLEMNQIHFSDFHRFRSSSRILSDTPASPQ